MHEERCTYKVTMTKLSSVQRVNNRLLFAVSKSTFDMGRYHAKYKLITFRIKRIHRYKIMASKFNQNGKRKRFGDACKYVFLIVLKKIKEKRSGSHEYSTIEVKI